MNIERACLAEFREYSDPCPDCKGRPHTNPLAKNDRSHTRLVYLQQLVNDLFFKNSSHIYLADWATDL